jgi:hypothetical protein
MKMLGSRPSDDDAPEAVRGKRTGKGKPATATGPAFEDVPDIEPF